MITPETSALLLLAAGHSERFGPGDKLAENFLGQPLGFHVVTALEAIPFHTRVAVVDGGTLDYARRGFEIVHNETERATLASSVALGVRTMRRDGIEGVVIAFADMPRVTAAQVYRLFDAEHGPETVVASSDGTHPKPPGLFGGAHFDLLAELTGEDALRPLILSGRHVVTNPTELVDINTPDDLAALRAKYARRKP